MRHARSPLAFTWMLAAAALAAGCSAATDGETTGSTDDAITAEEMAAGESFVDDHEDDPATGPARGYIVDDDLEKRIEPPSLALEESPETESALVASCRSATGYVRGRAFSICVTYVDGHPVEVHTAAAYLRMRAAAARDGVHVQIVSGFRTMAEQRALYSAYLHHRGNLAAPPGYSNHQSGHALDLNTASHGVYSWLAHHGSAYGFRRTVPSEAWHWEHW